jgi:uncharacterized membrane protein
VRRIQVLISVVLALGYPLLVYLSMGRLDPYWVAGGIALVLLVRAAISRDTIWLLVAAAAALIALVSLGGVGWLPLKLYPVAVSAIMLAVFGSSLLRPPSFVERIARAREGALSPEGIAYTRKVTMIWCGFFVVNGTIAAATALWASPEVWAAYTGLVSYILMGLLFAGEWVVRRRLRGRPASPEESHA